MNFDRLQVLHAVAIHGSVSAAAAALTMTPSAASQQLAKLEREVGQKLLEREGRGVRLTDAASRLAEHAERILTLAEEAKADLQGRHGAVFGTLGIAAFATAARGLVPRVMTELRRTYPELTVHLHEREPGDAIALVDRGTVDIAVAQDWSPTPLTLPANLTRTMLFEDHADLALPLDHPLATRDVVELGEIAGEGWISWPHGSLCHEWLVRTVRHSGVEPRIAHTVAEHPTQLALVADGHGVGIVPRLGRGPVPSGVRLVPTRPALTRQIYAVWRSGASRRPSITAALRALGRPGTAPGEHTGANDRAGSGDRAAC
ncbi:LysR family transcriptional regulator [Amycolatopsis cihanbeyliensis]|uniref:DNA-binding transcriptional LysR family regulator n=1 Tax=Amycolatopsis cihanbeyliensis TaxID=1128664 RepID=A0A542CSU5_AMYCI|nr:LysR family transcriptional regulator [Amycolatopsis cihanbeyliensis]TQI93901.1 DNA-binding transcriptional LysR family regulator [Amycolatopsis cihanbeyliensis]